MKLLNKSKNVELIITEKLLTQLGSYGVKSYPNEFGGFLIGYYSDDFKKLYISDSILPKKYKGIPCFFERSTDGIREFFENLFVKQNIYYVGEWHTHPNASTMYSQADLQTMMYIANCETVMIKNPVLLIISVNNNRILDSTFYIYDDERLSIYVDKDLAKQSD